MAQNENTRDSSSSEEQFQNKDQTAQRRETDQQNARDAQQNTNRYGNNDRGISGMSSNADHDETPGENTKSEKKRDSMDLDKENMSR